MNSNLCFDRTISLFRSIHISMFLDLTVKQVRLKIIGEHFWQTLSDVIGGKIVATFK